MNFTQEIFTKRLKLIREIDQELSTKKFLSSGNSPSVKSYKLKELGNVLQTKYPQLVETISDVEEDILSLKAYPLISVDNDSAASRFQKTGELWTAIINNKFAKFVKDDEEYLRKRIFTILAFLIPFQTARNIIQELITHNTKFTNKVKFFILGPAAAPCSKLTLEKLQGGNSCHWSLKWDGSFNDATMILQSKGDQSTICSEEVALLHELGHALNINNGKYKGKMTTSVEKIKDGVQIWEDDEDYNNINNVENSLRNEMGLQSRCSHDAMSIEEK